MTPEKRRLPLLIAALLLFIPIGFLQTQFIDPFYKKNYAVDQKQSAGCRRRSARRLCSGRVYRLPRGHCRNALGSHRRVFPQRRL